MRTGGGYTGGRSSSPSVSKISRTSSLSSFNTGNGGSGGGGSSGLLSPIMKRSSSTILSPTPSSISFMRTNKEFTSTSSTFMISDLCGISEQPGNMDGPFSKSKFYGVYGMTQLPHNKSAVVVSETVNSTLKLLNMSNRTVTTICKTGLLQPKGICMLNNNQILVCDSGHHRIRLFDMESGKLTFFAGNGQKGYRDGKLSEAQFDSPSDLFCIVDDYDRRTVYVTDTNNHVVRRIDLASSRVSTVAGGMGSTTVVDGFVDGIATKEALLRFPTGICHDPVNHDIIFISDSGNDCLRKLSLSDNYLNTVAKAYFNSPTGLSISPSDHGVIVCDTLNHRIVKMLRGSKQSGIILCGKKGVVGNVNGRCREATLSSPTNVLPLGNERFLVCDSGNHVIRLIEPVSNEMEPPSPHSLLNMSIASKSSRAGKEKTKSPERKRQELSYMDNMVKTPQKIPKDDKVTQSFMERMRYYSRTIRFNRSLAHLNTSDEVMSTIMNSIDQLKYYEAIFEHEQVITHIFLYYTSVLTKSTETYACLELGSVRFLKFVQDSKLIEERQLNSNDVFLVFSEATKHSPTHRMNIDEFIHGICLLACRRFHDAKKSGVPSNLLSIAEMVKHHTLVYTYVEKALSEYILPNARRIILSPTPTILSSSTIISTWANYEDVLFRIFQFYSTSKQSKRETDNWHSYQRGLYTLNIDEFFSFAKDFSIFPNIVSKNTITSLFYSCCQGNYVLQGLIGIVKAGENISIDFWEFLDCLGRIALLRFGEPPLNEIYTTPESRIEALMEHLNMSDGRKRFATDTGGRLFPNLSSKSSGLAYKQKLQRYIVFHPNATSNARRTNRSERSQLLNYSHFSSNRTRQSMDMMEANFSTGSIRGRGDNVEDKGTGTITCEEENCRIKCHQQDVILMYFDIARGNWKPIAQGTCELRDLPIVNPENLELRFMGGSSFVDDYDGSELRRNISIQNLPHIEVHEWHENTNGIGLDGGEHRVSLHVWRRGSGHLFNPDFAYALQFPSESASFPFEQQYDRIRNMGSGSTDDDAGDITNDEPIESNKEEVTPEELFDASVIVEPKSELFMDGIRNPANANEEFIDAFNNSVKIMDQSENPETDDGGKFLTTSMLNTPDPVRKRINTPITISDHGHNRRGHIDISTNRTPVVNNNNSSNNNGNSNSGINSNSYANTNNRTPKPNPEANIGSDKILTYEQIISDQIISYLELHFDRIADEKMDQTIDDQMRTSNKMNLSAPLGDFQTQTVLDSTIVNNGNSGLHHMLERSQRTIRDGVQKRLRLSSALYFLQNNNNRNNQVTEVFNRDRIQELLLHYVSMDPLLMKSLSSIKQYNDIIRECLLHLSPSDQIFIELFCKDSLGEGLFFYNNGFCVASEEICSAELHLTNSTPTMELFESIASVDVQVQGKSLSQQQINRDLGAFTNKLQIVCEEERGTILVTIPFAVPDIVQIRETEDLRTDTTSGTNVANNPYSIQESFKTYQFEIEVVIELARSDNRLETMRFKHSLPLHIFPNHSALDRTRGTLREHGNVLSQKLPSQFKAMRIFGMQQLVQRMK